MDKEVEILYARIQTLPALCDEAREILEQADAYCDAMGLLSIIEQAIKVLKRSNNSE